MGLLTCHQSACGYTAAERRIGPWAALLRIDVRFIQQDTNRSEPLPSLLAVAAYMLA
jgi:hypothetical protein